MVRDRRVVLDTHAWLWWHSAPELLGAAARSAIDAAEQVLVPAICSWELATKVSRGRLTLDRPLDVWLRQVHGHPRSVEQPMTWRIAATAGTLGERGFHGDPADRMIMASAMEANAPLLSKDTKIASWGGHRVVW